MVRPVRKEVRADEAVLTAATMRLATRYGRYGYQRIRRLLLNEGWKVSVKRVYRICRREGAEGTEQTNPSAEAPVAQRRLAHPAAPGAVQSRVVLRLMQDREVSAVCGNECCCPPRLAVAIEDRCFAGVQFRHVLDESPQCREYVG
jgi:transposase InsO family protein